MALNFIKSKPSDVAPFINAGHIKNQTNCSLHGIDEYPDWFTDTPPRYDYVVLNCIITCYLFLAIALVCDEYCVPSVERLSYKFGLSFDVAGATLMALATSSPEFFINLYATFLTEGDMGLGTIIGSSVFNTLAITACCCLYTGVNFSIDWWPITRDLLWYSFSVSLLTVLMWNGFIDWWESIVLVILYFVNVGNLLLDNTCQRKLRNREQPCKLKCFVPLGEVTDFNEMSYPDAEDELPFDFSKWPDDSYWHKFTWVITYPLECLFFLTIPNIRRSCTNNCSVLCLIMSMLWMSILTYLCSWCMTVVGYHLFVPESVMGLVILAAGTSVPEAISSIIVTKKGYGSMAVCNAVGSNTIDILLCLGVPWLVKSLCFPISPTRLAVSIISYGMVYTSACLLISAILLYTFFMITRFQLARTLGILCLTTYLMFIAVTVTIEMLYFDKSLPHCLHVPGK